MWKTVLFQIIQFSIVYSNSSNSANFVYTQLNIKIVLYITIQLSVVTVSMSKTVPFQKIQFSIRTQ